MFWFVFWTLAPGSQLCFVFPKYSQNCHNSRPLHNVYTNLHLCCSCPMPCDLSCVDVRLWVTECDETKTFSFRLKHDTDTDTHSRVVCYNRRHLKKTTRDVIKHGISWNWKVAIMLTNWPLSAEVGMVGHLFQSQIKISLHTLISI